MTYTSLLVGNDADLPTRIVRLRYWSLFAGSAFAVAVPHVLLPDPNVYVLQLVNARPRSLLLHQLTMWIPLVGVFAFPALLLAFYVPGTMTHGLSVRSLHGLASLFVIVGIGLYSFERYATIGQVSQDWQEGRRGRTWKTVREHGPLGFSLGVPTGLIPAVTATGRIFLVAVLVVLASALMRPLTADTLVWLPGLLLLLWSAYRLRGGMPAFDRHFYSTNAFYREIFRTDGRARMSDSRPLPYEALYWVPTRWRPHVWVSLRQLDRRLPLGRFVALGHALFWILIYQEAASTVVAAYLFIFSAAKNGVVVLLSTPPFAPQPFQLMHQSTVGWTVTRFFVNLRWTFPLLLSLLLVALLDDSFTYRAALGWTGVDVLLSLLTAVTASARAEARYRT